MKKRILILPQNTFMKTLSSFSRHLGISALMLLLFAAGAMAQIAIKGDTVWTMAGGPIRKGVVLVKDGKIEAVGANLPVPAGYRVISARVVTPGLIDAHTVIGLNGYMNQ